MLKYIVSPLLIATLLSGTAMAQTYNYRYTISGAGIVLDNDGTVQPEEPEVPDTPEVPEEPAEPPVTRKVTMADTTMPQGAIGSGNNYFFDFRSLLTVEDMETNAVTLEMLTNEAGEQIPPGLFFNGGFLIGTATTAGTYNFRIRAFHTADGVTVEDINSYSVVVTAPTYFEFNQATLPAAAVGETFSFDFKTLINDNRYGVSPQDLDWTVRAANGSVLPDGLILSETGVYEGIPTVAGTFNFIIEAKGGGHSSSRSYSVTVSGD